MVYNFLYSYFSCISYFLSSIIAFFIGLFVGTFGTKIIHRISTIMDQRENFFEYSTEEDFVEMNLSSSSFCPHCKSKLKWYEKIPLISFFTSFGKCRHCRKRISLMYPIVEIITAFIFTSFVYFLWPQPVAVIIPFAITIAFFLLIIDWETYYLPDFMIIILMWMGLVSSALYLIPTTPEMSIIGVFLGFSIWYTFGSLFYLATGNPALGDGDYKFMAAVGAWVGPLSLYYIHVIMLVLFLCYIVFMFFAKTFKWKIFDIQKQKSDKLKNDVDLIDHVEEIFALGPYIAMSFTLYIIYLYLF